MKTTTRRTAAYALSGASLAVMLAGCASNADPAVDTPITASPDAGSTAEPSAAPGADASSSGYTDGDYSAEGEYQSPGGAESINVGVTLEGGVITAVTVDGNATSGNAVRYQTEFADGIAGEVVGVPIDDISVDKVAGSSLTSDGFNAAIDQIKDDAAA